jgi:hypothetical protein
VRTRGWFGRQPAPVAPFGIEVMSDRRFIALVRALGVLAYVAVTLSCLHCEHTPCVFWTMVMPIVPLVVVLAGFHPWRRICPLAAISGLGARIAARSRGRRRDLAGIDPWVMPLSLVVLAVALAVRLLAANGDSCALLYMLASLAVVAIFVNAIFGGRAWCNYVCPVGVVERIYTDGGHLRRGASSRCTPCVGCKRGCPDIDADRAYRRDLLGPGRRLATYAFPGLVLAFYAYFRLRHGDWSAYFDGAWTRVPIGRELLFGAGFSFAPRVPALVAAPLTLALGMVASTIVFVILEHMLRARLRDSAARRHFTLSLASFCAFAIFYAFAGQPTLRALPWVSTLVPLALALLGACVLRRRLVAPALRPARRVGLPVVR